jgi:hypothetical protein
MLLRGECLIQSVTLNFAVHGERGAWHINVSFAPGHIENESETKEPMPYDLLHAMLVATFSEVARKLPGRVQYRDATVRR